MSDQLFGMASADLIVGVVLVLIGVRAGARRLPPSPIIGLSVPSAMSSEDAWYAGHDAAASTLVQGGALGVLGCLASLAVAPAWGPWVALGGFAAICCYFLAAVLACDRAARAVMVEIEADAD